MAKKKCLLCGIGLNDLTITRQDYLDKNLRYREYMLWRAMIYRCYYKVDVYNKTYNGCKVCPRWLTFSNFVEDIKQLQGYEMWANNPNKHIALDKDILGRYHAYYAPQYCKFVTMAENNRERNQRCGCPIVSAKSIANRLAKYSNPIFATDLKTNTVSKYPSVRECARAIGGYSGNILRCAKANKTYKGFSFRYA